ncbi:unnamed protein product [Oikopleura dioica]|uniref:CBF1-interacting co-repressor CIR N-terminal domain-containing protein n=1 Tax=Oikopleura dioica TaxID=34765 RepID=E4Z429_OIKDI|nr:unnamed protein product [Oikopleura dioica]
MGGASGLNILQQKSWHVLRRHNIERVRKDQREEKERQQKEDDRKDLAEFESKLDHLRSKASKDSTAVATTSSNEPLNLFKVTDLKDLKNVDKAIEDQQDEDKRLRKEGFLTYLGETVIENDSPWYATQRGVDTKKLKDEEKFAKDEIRKTNEDPLAKFAREMKWAAPKKEDNLIPLRQPEHLLRIDFEEEARQKLSFSPPRSKKSKKENKERRIKKEKKRKRKRSYSRSRSPSRSTRVKREKSTSPEFISESSPSRSKRNRDVKRERSSSPDYISESRSKKKKSKRSRRSPETAKSSSAASSSSAALIAMLKAKANKRIEREQAKTQELFDKINGVVKTQPEEPEEEVDERKRGYNSCFNPKFQATKERRRNSEY